jgi:hypothetical protein
MDNAAEEARLRATAAQAINDTRYTAAQANLEKYLQGERNALDEAFAKNKIWEEDYNKAVLTSDVTAAAARLQLAKSFTQDKTALDQQLTAAKIASIKSVGEKQRAEQATHVAEAQALAEGLTSSLAETVATTGAILEDFSRKALILVIDSIEKAIIAAQIKILAKAFASPDSIATFGVACLVKSAAIIAIVIAASETLKAKLTPAPQQFAERHCAGWCLPCLGWDTALFALRLPLWRSGARRDNFNKRGFSKPVAKASCFGVERLRRWQAIGTCHTSGIGWNNQQQCTRPIAPTASGYY